MPDSGAAAVAVVGAGPVGLVAAVELARCGLRPLMPPAVPEDGGAGALGGEGLERVLSLAAAASEAHG